MSLKSISSLGSSAGKILSWMILRDKKYLKEIEKGLPFFTKEELSKIEESKDYNQGIPFSEINKILSSKGMILKLPTFKKYVTLKLIPDSIGTQKTDKGIIGLYPPKVIRAINFVKYSLYANLDFEPIVNRYLDQFKMTALELIESSFPGNMWLIDFLGGDAPNAIRRYADELLEEKVINNEETKKIVHLVENIENSMHTAHESFHALLKVLGDISIPGKKGYGMIQSIDES